MPYVINPFTGNFDYYAAASGGGSSNTFGNIYYVTASQSLTIPVNWENFVTAPQTIDGVLTVNGRNTVNG